MVDERAGDKLESEEKSHTKGVSLLLGDPKKAILRLSIPTIIAMVINSLYALIDGIWVAGLGGDALAAIGFVNPLYLIVMGFSNGLGAGATSVISRYIGEKNKKQADNTALHVILLIAILTIIFTVVLLLFLKEILIAIGTGPEVLNLSMTYGRILFIGTVFMVFSSTAYGILRAEGNVTKTTYGMLVGAIINMILDPIFIYQFGMGIFGAGLATILSLAIVSILILYWFKEETYIDFSFKDFVYNNKLIKQILNVGLPAGFEFLIIAFLNGFLNLILMMVSNVQGVAVYTAGWRVVMMGMVTPIAIGISVVAVTGANYGGRRYENLKII
ncbi:MAG: MATE family efflux transporter, partial [Methanobrevibacter sp.]|nr:MATE family efflux transporter [Methanobrevibacter sp.]